MDKIDINSADAQSEDVVGENIRRLGDLFPELLTEGPAGPSVNIDVLKQLVGDSSVSDIDEKYGLSWFGKRDARKMALTPSLGTLLPRPEESEDWDNTKNLMIEGDNLEVLKLLQKSYSGKVKLIYIDPPYNTGKDFVYPDNYQDNIKNYLELTGQTEEGRKTTSNTESSGRFHTDWLNMIYPRLKMAQSLLTDDGLIFISIDDTEAGNLRGVLDEIFGADNFVEDYVWESNFRPDNSSLIERENAQHVLCYVKAKKQLTQLTGAPKKTEGLPSLTKSSMGKSILRFKPDSVEFRIPDGIYRSSVLDSGYELLDDVEVKNGKSKGDFRLSGPVIWSQSYLDDQVAQGTTIVIKAISFVPYSSKSETSTLAPTTLIPKDQVGDVLAGNADLRRVMGSVIFPHPKPVSLLTYLVRSCTTESFDCHDIVLDFFAGSGTTGQAVMEQNALDGGNRQFVLVQLPEPLFEENKEQAAALAFCKEHKLEENIAALTAERLRRAGAKVRSENPMFAGDVGFRVFKLAESNIRAWNPLTEDLEGTLRTSEDHLVEGRSELDVLYEILLKRGLDLCIPIETKEIAGHHVNAVGGGVLFACLDSQIAQTDVETLAEGIVAWRKELSVVGDVNCIFRDSAFDNDVAKSNMSSILEQAGFTRIQSL